MEAAFAEVRQYRAMMRTVAELLAKIPAARTPAFSSAPLS